MGALLLIKLMHGLGRWRRYLGIFRLCVDNWQLNKLTIKNKYLLSRINNLMDQLHGATMFSKIKLWFGYRHYNCVVISFRLMNVPIIFMDNMISFLV